jgi:hypothetical protein
MRYIPLIGIIALVVLLWVPVVPAETVSPIITIPVSQAGAANPNITMPNETLPENNSTNLSFNYANASSIYINESINASRKVLEKAALAIESEDKMGFMETMSNETLRRVIGEPDLSSPDALNLSRGMKEAKFIWMAGDIITYEMAIGNVTYSLTTIKEGGVWKISGF